MPRRRAAPCRGCAPSRRRARPSLPATTTQRREDLSRAHRTDSPPFLQLPGQFRPEGRNARFIILERPLDAAADVDGAGQEVQVVPFERPDLPRPEPCERAHREHCPPGRLAGPNLALAPFSAAVTDRARGRVSIPPK